MSINNTIAEAQPNINKHSENPLTAAQCTPNFLPQLSETVSAGSWLSIYPVFSQLINHFIQLPQPLLIFNARHWQAASTVIAEATDDNYPQLALLNYDQQKLFGRLNLHADHNIDFHQGEIYNFNNGCLILHISPLLVNPNLWFLLKAFLISHKIPATSAVNGDKLKGQYPAESEKNLNTKIILVANRYQLDELMQIDPEYNQMGSLFAELSSEIKTTDENILALQRYCQQLVKEQKLAKVSTEALALLFHHLSCKCEHQQKILFAPEIIENLLRYAQLFLTEKTEISAVHLQKAIDIQAQAQSLAQNFSEQALLEKQLRIQLTGEEIGQINGMSVVELMGYPTEFGEIFRISASDMIGDGEIIDVERKVELAGNIHAKSTLIVQGYLHHVFTHTANFPLSCNVVFEQSYQESDGDSAALAILLAVISCYAQRPLAQNLFVTGALDQHGNVLAIGGINQKINAVTRLFNLGLLDQAVTILIPKANQINLTLEANTLALISAKKINIYAINHCQEALPLAMKLSFEKVIELINQRIESLHKEEIDSQHLGLFQRFIQHFK
ncbi:MAG: AAA family ATPase [Psychromonas sp.]|nr:AAA family ATPase [Psychromonas sp.]